MVKGKKIFLCFFVIITLNIHAQETRNYVLTQDLVYTTHTPIMNPDGTAFTGNFYGNGHTIIIRGFAPDVTNNFGLFGEVGTGAVIRDLTVMYETATGGAVTISPASGGRFGGIAGTVSGGARFENVLVKGAVIVGGSGTITAGGMIGQITSTATTRKATITNAYGGLNLTVNRNGYIGGVAGMIGTSTTAGAAADLKGITVVGNITIGTSTTNRVNGELYAGGLAGSVRGAGAGTSLAVFDDVEYKTGIITINKGTGNDYLGGAIGYINGNVDILVCSALATRFNIDKNTGSTTTTNFYVGGFIGISDSNLSANIRNCYSENPVILVANGTISTCRVGGFAGGLNADIAYCYTKSDISVRSSNYIFVGGFSGYLFSGSNALFCYAAGNVSVIGEGSGVITVGGFSGWSMGSVFHSYALGDVYIDATGSIYAGGFIGGHSVSVENCFALGNVIAHCSTNSTNYIGGLTGDVYSSTSILKNCIVAVLPRNINNGMSITATGGTTRRIGRIYGSTHASATRSNNYAWNGIRLFNDSAYDTGNSAPDTTMTALTRVHDGKDGADTTSGFFRIASNWTNLGYTQTVTYAAGNTQGIPAGTYYAWDFIGIEGRGYPRIRHPSGVGVLGEQ